MSNDLFAMVAARYASKTEIEKYRRRAGAGLLDWEETVRKRYHGTLGRVIDIGCGCGREALALARFGHAVTGIDISAEEVEIARGQAQSAGLKIDFRLTGGTRLDLPLDSFDYALLWSQVLGNVPRERNRHSLLRQIHGILCPGGVLSLSVHNRAVCEPIAIKQGLLQTTSGLDLEDGDFIEKGDDNSVGLCYWHYFSRQELVEQMRQAGFSVVDCDVAPAFGQTGADPRQIGWDTLLIAVARKAGQQESGGGLKAPTSRSEA